MVNFIKIPINFKRKDEFWILLWIWNDWRKKSSLNYEYEIYSRSIKFDYFSNKNIQKGVSLFYFTEVLNAFVEKYNQLDKNEVDDMKKNKEK